MTDENWEQIGHDIANNTHLTAVTTFEISSGDFNDQKISSLFRGLTRSSSITELTLHNCGVSIAGIQCMMPFLQNANKLTGLYLRNNDLQSEGFNSLLRALRNSPIKSLYVPRCGIESIEIDIEHTPRHLRALNLSDNSINADGCRALVTLLQREDATLDHLNLEQNNIDDEGVQVLVEALQSNTSLRGLYLESFKRNAKISEQGKAMLLKLVSDVSSIESLLQSNHTLSRITFERYEHTGYSTDNEDEDEQILEQYIDKAVALTGNEKVVQILLNSEKRAKLAELQGVSQESLYSEINPLHLPEVLALVGDYHGHGELYVALRSSIAGVISTVNKRQFLKQQIAEYKTKLAAAEAELAAIEAAEVHDELGAGSEESRSNKRRRY